MEMLELADGRTLTYEDTGARDGTPVLYQHGTGDSRLCTHPDETIAADLGLRLISADRPGVGGSTVKKHRTLLDWGSDTEQLADHLGVEHVVLAGHSGGGPHSFAIAHRLGDRVARIVVAAPLGPFDHGGTKAMVKDSDLTLIFKLAHTKFIAVAAGKAESKHYSKDVSGFVRHCAEAWPGDHDIFTDPALEPMFEAEFLAAFEQGGIGALDDMWAYLEWGFDIGELTQPTDIFVGTNDDIIDPEMSNLIQQRITDSSLTTWEGAGHYGVYRTDRWTQLLTAAAART
jgi:pimeloyl-ACP methyl ester carboxylesterase